MRSIHRILALPLLLISVAAAHAGTDADGEADAVAETLARSEVVFARAVALEHGWSVTEPLMQQAREALAAGDLDQARELAERALVTAEKAVEQAQTEAELWKTRVVGA